jgi:hypothetical protein
MSWERERESDDSEVRRYDHATLAVRKFYERLLDAGRGFTKKAYADSFSFAAAATLAGTAAEVAVGTALRTIVDEKQLGNVAEVALKYIRQFNLDDNRIRDTWDAIAADAIQDESFWSDFKKHCVRRNSVVHSGMIKRSDESLTEATKDDAEQSIEAVAQLIEHVKDVLVDHGLSAYTGRP